MAWSSPRTWVTAETVTAAHMNQEVRDNLDALNPLDSVGATSWTPTLEATSTNPGGADSITGRYWRVGPIVFAWARFVWTSEQAGSGTYFVTLPVASSGISASGNGFGGQSIGSFLARDNSSTANSRGGSVRLSAADEIRFDAADGGSVTDSAPFTWATDDVLSFCVSYPAA